MISAPIANSGSIRHMPTRIENASATAPMIGRTSSPGITHSEAIENPVARARAGIASDSVASTPGVNAASVAEMTQFRATATTMFGANAKPTLATAASRQSVDRNRIIPATFPAKRRATKRAPYTRPTSWNGSAIAAATPRARSSRSNSCSYSSEASTTKPMSDTATNGSEYQSRRSVGTLWTMRQLSANEGGSSAVSATSSLAPAARRSHEPRTGSCSRRARTAKITVGTTKTRNGSRQPNEKARNPATSGPTNEPTAFAARCTLNTRWRASIG